MPSYEDLQNAMTMLAGFLLMLGVFVALLPVGECDQCPHCRRERIRGSGTTAFCKLHSRPIDQCRDMHD